MCVELRYLNAPFIHVYMRYKMYVLNEQFQFLNMVSMEMNYNWCIQTFEVFELGDRQLLAT